MQLITLAYCPNLSLMNLNTSICIEYNDNNNDNDNNNIKYILA